MEYLSMLLLFLSILIIAISLPYFSLSSISSRIFWKRISILSLLITILLFIESITINAYSTTVLYNGLFSHNLQNTIFIGLILFSGLFLNTIGFISPSSSILNIEIISLETRDRERLVFVFSLIIGGIILSGASDFLTIFLGLELQSYSAYILAASYKNNEPSEAAGLKYFLLGALSSALIFMGLGLLYIYTGNLNIELSFMILKSFKTFNINNIIPYIGAILLLIGFFWKIAAAPLQAWSIDVYDAVPTRTTAILSVLPKIGLISFLVKLIFDITSINQTDLFTGQFYGSTLYDINFIIYIVIGLCLIVGSIYGIFQPRIKRLLAYSSVLNIGFILMGSLLINYGQFDSFNPLFYLIQYIISTVTIWLCLTSVEKISLIEVITTSQLQGLSNSNNNKFLNSNLSSINPIYLGVSLTILILSTAGIPPMIGFFAKYEIILLSLKSEYFSLAILAILASLISTYYYLNIVKNIWFKGFRSKTEVINLSIPVVRLKDNFKLSEFVGNSSLIPLLTLGILLFTLQYSVIYIFITLTF